MAMLRRGRRRTVRTRSLAAAAAAATAALVAAEGLHLWRRHRARMPAHPRHVLIDRDVTAQETLDVLRAGYRSGSANETAVLNLFVSFGATFAVARAVTHSIRRGVGPLRNIRIGRRHIHHFVPGILLALGAGGVSISVRHEQLDTWLAVPFGAGAALIIDETALLLELSDVYWSEQGVLSIDVGLGAVSALATLALVIRMIRRGEAVVLAP